MLLCDDMPESAVCGVVTGEGPSDCPGEGWACSILAIGIADLLLANDEVMGGCSETSGRLGTMRVFPCDEGGPESIILGDRSGWASS